MPASADILLENGESTWITVAPHPYERALRNPLKGFTGGNNEWRTLQMVYLYWNDIENHESDGIEKIRQLVNARWSDFPGQNVKVIPRVILHWDGTSRKYWPSDMQTDDYTSEQFQRRVVRLIERMGVLWDNDPRVAFVEVGFIGKWGEHHSPSPTPEIQALISDAFERSFSNKLASVRHPWREFTPGGFGAYWDSFAHYQQMYPHGKPLADMMREDPTYWQRNYIGGEVAYNWGDWKIQPGETPAQSVRLAVHRDYIINTIRWLHTTQLRWISGYENNVSAADLPATRAGAELMQKAFGYRFLLEEAGFPAQVEANVPFEVELKVRNDGAAPFYYDWPLELALLDPQTLEPVWRAPFEDVDIRDWLPGSGWPEPIWQPYNKWPGFVGVWPQGILEYETPALQYSARSEFTADVPDGEYILAVAILNPAGNKPGVRFASANYLTGGRHPIGTLAVGAGRSAQLPANFIFNDPSADTSLNYELPSVILLPEFSFQTIGNPLSGVIEFNASGSTIHGGQIVSYEWDFENDGTIDATGMVVTHTYEEPGSYVARLTVTDSQGNTNTTSRRFTVVRRTTFGNNLQPWPLPGRVQAEDFDEGGQGVAYFDTTDGNSGNSTYRAGESVDIQQIATGNDSGGRNVGWTAAGEWLEYTVSVAESGLYRLDFRVATTSTGGAIAASVDGYPLGAVLNLPNTGGWQVFQTVSMNDVYLSAGRQIIRITFPNGNLNINWWEAVLVTPNEPLPASAAFPSYGLRGAWLFDEPSGTLAFDSSGLARHGTLVNSSRTAGIFGGGVGLNNPASVVTLPNFDVSSSALTLSAWMRWAGATTADSRIFSKATSTNIGDHIIALGTHTGGRLRARLKTNGVTTELFTPNDVIAVQTWHHVALRYNGGSLEIYVDGQAVASTPVTGKVDAGATIPAAIGNQPTGAGDRRFNGIIDHVLLYGRALSTEELGALAGISVTMPPLSFATWMTSLENPPPLGMRGPLDDSMGARIPNLLAYALGGHPLDPDSVTMPVMEFIPGETEGMPGQMALTYLRAQSDLLYFVEVSDSLHHGSWTTDGVDQGSGEVGNIVTASFPLNESGERVFMRLRVTSIEPISATD